MGPIPSNFLVKYLQHALATRFISIPVFFRELFEKIRSEEASVIGNISVFIEYITLLELSLPQLTAYQLVEQRESLNAKDLKTIVISFRKNQNIQNNANHNHLNVEYPQQNGVVTSSESSATETDVKKGMKRKRDDITQNESNINGLENYEGKDSDSFVRNKKTSLDNGTAGKESDEKLQSLAETATIFAYILIKSLYYYVDGHYTKSKSNNHEALIDHEMVNNSSLNNLFQNFSTELILLLTTKSSRLLNTIFSNQRTRFLLHVSRSLNTSMWKALRQLLENGFLEIFDKIIFHSSTSNEIRKSMSSVTIEEIKKLWDSTMEFLSFLSESDTGGVYCMQDFWQNQNTNLKICASNALTLIINDEIFSNNLKRANIEHSFFILDSLRQLKKMSMTNFFLEMMLCTLKIMHNIPTKSNIPIGDFVLQHNLGTLIICKSFFLSKLPLLFQQWLQKYNKDKEFYDLYIGNSTSDKDNLKLNHVERSLRLMKKFPDLYTLTNG